MDVNPNELWKQCLLLIRDNVTEQQFNTWFKPVCFESYAAASKTLLLRVPSAFVYEYLEENYIDLLSKVLTRVFGKGVKLSYRIVQDKEHGITTVEESEPVDNLVSQQPTRRGNQSPTCITFWSTDRRKIDKKYANIRTKYIDKAKIKYDIRYVKDDEFHYTAVPLANNGNAAATTNGK